MTTKKGRLQEFKFIKLVIIVRKVLETNLCKINYSDSLEELAEATVQLLDKKIIEYRLFFELPIIEQIVVNYFDTVEEFREFIYEIRDERDSLPEYARGTYDNEMVNACVNPKFQLKRLYTASHELFHILYMKYILNDDYSKRIVWYDEGMAQFMSGEKDSLSDNDSFKKFYLKVREKTKIIPHMNSVEHGNSFVNEDYNGYDLSYLSIKYLPEILSVEQFKNLMSNFSEIRQFGNDIIQNMFSYYDEKLENKNVVKK